MLKLALFWTEEKEGFGIGSSRFFNGLGSLVTQRLSMESRLLQVNLRNLSEHILYCVGYGRCKAEGGGVVL